MSDQTPVETAAEVLYHSMPLDINGSRAPWESVTASQTGDVWREHARLALGSLAQHRDDIARAIYESDRKAVDRVWADEGENYKGMYRANADAVLAYLGGAR